MISPLAALPIQTHIAAMDKIHLTDDEWRTKLSAEQYNILRQAGTERAFTGAYEKLKAEGLYLCGGRKRPALLHQQRRIEVQAAFIVPSISRLRRILRKSKPL